jgi:hypothetical protein
MMPLSTHPNHNFAKPLQGVEICQKLSIPPTKEGASPGAYAAALVQPPAVLLQLFAAPSLPGGSLSPGLSLRPVRGVGLVYTAVAIPSPSHGSPERVFAKPPPPIADLLSAEKGGGASLVNDPSSEKPHTGGV